MVATVGIKDYGDKDNLVLNLWISILSESFRTNFYPKISIKVNLHATYVRTKKYAKILDKTLMFTYKQQKISKPLSTFLVSLVKQHAVV
jgi:hypothetical protein